MARRPHWDCPIYFSHKSRVESRVSRKMGEKKRWKAVKVWQPLKDSLLRGHGIFIFHKSWEESLEATSWCKIYFYQKRVLNWEIFGHLYLFARNKELWTIHGSTAFVMVLGQKSFNVFFTFVINNKLCQYQKACSYVMWKKKKLTTTK